jgi:hypothetical protein
VPLPPWAQGRAQALLPRVGGRLLTDSTAASADGRNTALMNWTSETLREGLGWTSPSPKAFALTALTRTAGAHGVAGRTF